ncbi:hypothetical protein C6A86_018205 [Mycobacterium sp. ITM-2016-00316]|uniref:hypothetical protein n=1 Tax=Mycobacterium sp. ITM-2016-00316 TaxID=2099695 RepID=UPI000CFA303F|nr:hypothetical protein [Mycobacterium sp. ITM-2016-00316]WNG80179.1 hypothetical protein C6A86_018205 [Mycobacterium sp. ITM-2016-00316]
MPTPSIFNFDADNLGAYEPEKTDKLLTEQPAVFLNHLRVAQALRGWAKRAEDRTFGSEEYQKGYIRALREVAAHLRQGDYVEGGEMLFSEGPEAEATANDE